jgi:RHH-type rel operon transcriptional repressor/antitoxin RelB
MEANMFSVRLDPNLEKRLEKLSKKTGRSKSHYAKQAIQEFLDDREDYLAAIAVLERNEPTMSLENLRKKLGLER